MNRTQRRGDASRSKLLSTTADLLQKQGYSSTGLNQILEQSGAPKGSLYFHFPGGKEQLVSAALTQSAESVTEALEAMLVSAPTAVAAVHSVIAFFAAQLSASKFSKGCPVATVALEQAASSDALQAVCSQAYRRWHLLVEQRLLRDGLHASRAESLANLFLVTLEGALLVSRAHRSTEPLERAGRELVRILEQGESS